MYRLLLVDDDRKFCSMLSQFLEGEGFTCESVHDGPSALEKATHTEFDVLILDVMMPKMNGFEVVRRLRKTRGTPVIMLTARGDEQDAIIGLEIGADDYLAKPCNPKVLSARLRAVLRRTDGGSQVVLESRESVTVGDVMIHPGSRQVMVGGRSVDLTSTEFKILEVLIRTPGTVVGKETLSLKGLNRKLIPYDRSIDFHIGSLRRKLGLGYDQAPRIITIRNEGYLFSVPMEP
ncbi:MAG: response regulator transcription factor [Magnetococcales bacterium]|nr:response regulator transcription factor [Magnetococcales bacterium]MBF0151312.1 response regulator transcription factor [Magnetococcales bacterium]MBF0348663.1 response regulator transcription factor [Magnetococcales bacterium]